MPKLKNSNTTFWVIFKQCEVIFKKFFEITSSEIDFLWQKNDFCPSVRKMPRDGIPRYLSAISEKNPPFLPTRMKREEEEEWASVSKV